MSEAARAKLREMQNRLAEDAQTVMTRGDLLRLRAYWGDLEEALRLDTEEPTD